jgi:hypothetical protein
MSRVEAALEPLVMALQADGYEAVVTEAPGEVLFKIVAGQNACEECLSPRSILEPIIQHALRAGGVEANLKLIYPLEH